MHSIRPFLFSSVEFALLFWIKRTLKIDVLASREQAPSAQDIQGTLPSEDDLTDFELEDEFEELDLNQLINKAVSNVVDKVAKES